MCVSVYTNVYIFHKARALPLWTLSIYEAHRTAICLSNPVWRRFLNGCSYLEGYHLLNGSRPEYMVSIGWKTECHSSRELWVLKWDPFYMHVYVCMLGHVPVGSWCQSTCMCVSVKAKEPAQLLSQGNTTHLIWDRLSHGPGVHRSSQLINFRDPPVPPYLLGAGIASTGHCA